MMCSSLTSVLILLHIFTAASSHSPREILREEAFLFVPPLSDVVDTLQSGLSQNFQDVDVRVVECPDLRQEPFSLAGRGLGGKPTIVEYGSQFYLTPVANRDKMYDIKDVNQQVGVNPAFVVGAAAGPWPYVGQSCEYIANSVVVDGNVYSGTQIAKVVDEELQTMTLPNDVTNYAFTAHFFVSQGQPGSVIKVKARRRIGEDDFVTASRETIKRAFPGKSVGLGGTFLVTNSRTKHHVQSNFSKVHLVTEPQNNYWLKFFDMDPPMVAVGTMLTSDPGLDMRLCHFHSLSNHSAAGHYYYDMDPETVEYLAYLQLADKVVRLDRPL